jgi:hypothetical protein
LQYGDSLYDLEHKIKEQLGEHKDFIQIMPMVMIRSTDKDIVYSGKNYIAYNYRENNDEDMNGLKLSTDDTETIGTMSIRFARRVANSKIRITNILSDYVRGLFNAEDYEKDGPQTESYDAINFYNVWDRDSCYLKSSLATGVVDNCLGYSNIRYNPLKYFKITNNDTRFYIDFYIAHLPHFQAVLPYDNVDSIALELVLY